MNFANAHIMELNSTDSSDRGDIDWVIASTGASTFTMRYRASAGSYTGGTPAGTIVDNVWYQLVTTVKLSGDNKYIKTYVNGVLFHTSNILTYPATSPVLDVSRDTIQVGDFRFGNGADSEIHSWAVWDRTLSKNAVKSIYNQGVETLNLLKRKGNYRKHKRLQHWIIPEIDELDLGHDYGLSKSLSGVIQGETPRDMMNDDLNITAVDDLVGSTPSGR
jgi:hypothetical protein